MVISLFMLVSLNGWSQSSWKKKKISLQTGSGLAEWKFIGLDPQTENVKIPDLDADGWRNITVPGDVNVELMKQEVIPDMHFDTLAREAYWISSKEWWYTVAFDADFVDGRATKLVLDFVDGSSEIWLNGQKLGAMENSFYPHRFSVEQLLKKKDNRLFIRFLSIDQLLGGPRTDELLGWKERRSFLRKPQYNFGWDWTLPVPGIGLAGDVYIENGNEFVLDELGIQTFIDGRVDFNFEVSKPAKEVGYKISLQVEGFGTQFNDTIDRTLNKSYTSYTSVSITDPQLWWPNGYGDANLYDYEIKLLVDGVAVDSKKGKFGIRETETRETPFTPSAGSGYAFELLVNNEPVFCKGTNWIPLEIWPGAIPVEKYRFYLEKAKEANFNMIRVWGGGIYEKDLFYEICDELGLMVWQDFMFASSGYPVHHLMDEIITEANYQLFRLRNHPSIVIWCGGNEDYQSWRHAKDYKAADDADSDPFYVNRLEDDPILYTMLLRGVVDRFGQSVPYVESSPMSREDSGNRPNSGNSHISSWKTALFWCDGHPSQWRKHFERVCSFDSEFCVQGPAKLNTMQSFLSEENYWPPNEAWIYHIQRGHGNRPHYQQTLFIAGDIMGEIHSLEEYVKHGQATHLEMTRSEYESARYDRPNNGGTMSWMYNDCWPTANWSIIDYYCQPKPAYYAAKRACEPVLPIIFERDSIIRFAVANETLEDHKFELTYGLETLAGEIVWEESQTVDVPRNSTSEYFRMNHSDLSGDKNSFLFVRANCDGKALNTVSYFADGWKDIPWEQPKLKLEMLSQQEVDGQWETVVQVSADTFARLVYLFEKDKLELKAGMPLPASWFMDNYFDLPAGETREVVIQSDKKNRLKDLAVGSWMGDWE
ncbi:beta-mannosidase [Mangrovibacterium diazotrophicum]|uniref:Beta-mannosidase n=1 Tax=Mangrovibacterium diazotrophicum TaxID=1261403 RepID=A0A419VYH8_9BACT|nr:beta-mannosidase [Mangrovibacterium diazotrophicum]